MLAQPWVTPQGTVTWCSSWQLARCVAVLRALSVDTESVSVTVLEPYVSCMVQGRRGQHGHLSRPYRAGQDASSSGVRRSKVGEQQYGSRTAGALRGDLVSTLPITQKVLGLCTAIALVQSFSNEYDALETTACLCTRMHHRH